MDHYHYFSHDFSGTGVAGVARVMRLNGGKNKGNYCYEEQLRRTAISEHIGLKEDWENRKLQTVRVSISFNTLQIILKQ